jgi:hypothetical protein
MLLAQDLRQHGAGLLTPVFLIPGHEDDFFAVGGTVFGGHMEPFRSKAGGTESGAQGQEDRVIFHEKTKAGEKITGPQEEVLGGKER